MVQLYANFIKAEWTFQFTISLYFFALLSYALCLFWPSSKDGKARYYLLARILFLAAWGSNAYTLIQREAATGWSPALTLFESLIAFSAIFGVLAAGVEWTKKIPLLGFLCLLILFGAMTLAMGHGGVEMDALPSAIRRAGSLPNSWFCLAAYSNLTLAFAVGIVALLKPAAVGFQSGSFWARALGSANINLEKMNRQWARFGFLMLASGLVIGGTWARPAWSGYWTWNQKENWSFLGLLIYGAVLHLHYVPAHKGRTALWASLLAWGLVVPAYFGMGLTH